MAVDMLADQAIKLVSAKEIRWKIDKNMNPRKAPGIDEITFKELPKKGIVMLTYLYNANFRLKYVSSYFKVAEIIIIKLKCSGD